MNKTQDHPKLKYFCWDQNMLPNCHKRKMSKGQYSMGMLYFFLINHSSDTHETKRREWYVEILTFPYRLTRGKGSYSYVIDAKLGVPSASLNWQTFGHEMLQDVPESSANCLAYGRVCMLIKFRLTATLKRARLAYVGDFLNPRMIFRKIFQQRSHTINFQMIPSIIKIKQS